MGSGKKHLQSFFFFSTTEVFASTASQLEGVCEFKLSKTYLTSVRPPSQKDMSETSSKRASKKIPSVMKISNNRSSYLLDQPPTSNNK